MRILNTVRNNQVSFDKMRHGIHISILRGKVPLLAQHRMVISQKKDVERSDNHCVFFIRCRASEHRTSSFSTFENQ